MDKDEENRAGGGGEKRGVKRPAQGERTRGRAYYEFKEEIQYNRYLSSMTQALQGFPSEPGQMILYPPDSVFKHDQTLSTQGQIPTSSA